MWCSANPEWTSPGVASFFVAVSSFGLVPRLLRPLRRASLSYQVPCPRNAPSRIVFKRGTGRAEVKGVSQVIKDRPMVILTRNVFSRQATFRVGYISLRANLLVLVACGNVTRGRDVPKVGFCQGRLTKCSGQVYFLESATIRQGGEGPTFRLLKGRVRLMVTRATSVATVEHVTRRYVTKRRSRDFRGNLRRVF